MSLVFVMILALTCVLTLIAAVYGVVGLDALSLAHAAASESLIPVRGFRFTGQSAFDAETLAAVTADFAGRELTLAELEQAAERVTRFYRDRGYLVAQALIPAQEIGEDGIIEIAVHEGRYGQVRVHNESRLKEGVAEAVLEAGSVAAGAWIKEAPLERALLLLNELPGVSARGELAAGGAPGTSDLAVFLRDGDRLTGLARVDNFGHELTGRVRGSVMVDANNVRGYADRLSLQVTTAGSTLLHGSLNYSAPLHGTPVRLGAGYTSSRYEMGGALAALDVHGTMSAWRLSLSYPLRRALPRAASASLRSAGGRSSMPAVSWQRLDGEVVAERRDLEDSVAGLSGERQVQALQLAARGSAQAWGGTVEFGIVATAGRLHIVDAVERLFDSLTARTEGAFVKVHAEATHQRLVGQGMSLRSRVAGQWASKNLHSSEKLALGGAQAVRAYAPGEASGDVGVLASAELQGRLFGPAWRWAGFVDAGFVQLNKDPWQAGENTRALYGVGAGLVYAPSPSFDLRLDYAVPVPSGAADGRLGVSATVRW